MICVEQLAKLYTQKNRPVPVGVQGISFEAAPGEVFGLLGPNGAGKTTTLRLLATILQPDSGTATIDGCDLVRDPLGVRRRIGFLSGDMGLYHRLTPRETLMHFGQLYGLPKAQIRERVGYLCERLGIRDVADERIDRFSTGMRQKVAIARALVHDPRVVILDEPTSGLDVPSAHMVEHFILESKREGKCILYSTHLMEEAEHLCDRIAVVNEGRLQALGTIGELRRMSGRQTLREIFLALLGLQERARSAAASA